MSTAERPAPAAERAPASVDRIVLPARWGRAQRLKNTAIYMALRVAVGTASALGPGLSRALALGGGWLAYLVARPWRRRAWTQLARAFPDASAREVTALSRGVFMHLGRCAAEVLDLRRSLARVRFAEGAEACLRDALAGGRGAIVASGHLGNWELLAQAVAARFPTTAVARPAYDPRLTAWIARERTAGGLDLIWRKRREPLSTARDLVRALRRGRLVALLVDQHSAVPGVAAPFFGRPAHTPSAPVVLARRAGVPLLFVWIRREGGEHVIRAETVCIPSELDDEAAVSAVTTHINRRLEDEIRKDPRQWVWLHERWQPTRPDDS